MQAGVVQGGDLGTTHALDARTCIGNGRCALTHLPGHLQPVACADEVARLGRLFGACQQAAFHCSQTLARARVVWIQLRRIAKVHQRPVAVFAQAAATQILLAGTVEAQHPLCGFHCALQCAHRRVLRSERQRHDGQLTRLFQRAVLTVGLRDQRLAALDQPALRLLQPAPAGRVLAVGALLDCQIQRNRIVGVAIEPIVLQCLVGALAHLRQRLIAQVHWRRLPLRHGFGGFFATDGHIRLARHRGGGSGLRRSGRRWQMPSISRPRPAGSD